MADCIFCKIASGAMKTEFLYEDEQVVVFKDIYPKARVHLLIVAKEHIKNLSEVPDNRRDLMTHMLLTLPKVAKEQGLTDGFRTVINTGAGGGQEIDHIHFHLLGGGALPRM